MFIKKINLPVDKSTQEVPFTKLDDALRPERAGKITTIQCFHNGFLDGLTADC
ncbi:hypothetical protein BN128_926 [Cronobacter sakazakii 696]|nr:hypothetical protein BN128_926 [Cronobacter sakazakii 696]